MSELRRSRWRGRIAVASVALLPVVACATSASARALASASLPASNIRNVFTTLDFKTCKRVSGDKDGGRWTCRGLKGFEVLFAEGDLRHFLAYGAKARQQKAATQTLGPFNSIFKETGASAEDRTVIQWRGTMQGGTFIPFATIVRYHLDTGDAGAGDRRRTQVLVVTKLGGPDSAEACHVAYIDAVANKEANALANATADETACGFDCRKPPATVGKPGSISLVPTART